MDDGPHMPADDLAGPASWDDARRMEAWAGESRVNLIRLVALIALYARHLVDVRVHPEVAGGSYHRHVTAVVVAWAVGVVVVYGMLVRRRVPAGLKYATLGMDLVGVTLVGIAAGGPRPSLVALYFVVIASAPLRLSLGLVWAATVGAWGGYAALLMYYAWVVVGWDRYYATPGLRIPRTEEAAWVLAMGVAGLMAGQVVRQARRLATGYPVSVAGGGEGD